MNDEIMVSVCCLVYNHEKYLRQCLDGFMMQNTNFKFEVLIHDDASTDGSPDIIRKYAEKYPELIKPIYQKENQYTKGIQMSWAYQYPRARGKYIALCEGDDYWTNPKKLQKQYDMMESNPNCVFCAHRVQIITESGEKLEKYLPEEEMNSQIILARSMVEAIMNNTSFFQTSSFFFRASIVKKCIPLMPRFMSIATVGDLPLKLLYAAEGDYAYLNMTMSCYRMNSMGSWSDQMNKDINSRVKYLNNEIDYLKEYNKFTNSCYSTIIDDRCKRLEFKIMQLNHDFKSMKKKKYKDLLSKLTFKERLYVYIFGYFPKFEPIYKKMKGNNR